MSQRSILVVFLLLCIGTIEAQARGNLAYSNFGKRQTSRTQPAWCVEGPAASGCSLSTYISRGASFISGLSGSLDHVDVAVGYLSGTPGVVVTLVTDEGGFPSIHNPILESWTVDQEPFCCTKKLNIRLTSVVNPPLSSGVKYWLLVSPLGFDSLSGWQSSPKAKDHFATSLNGGHDWNLDEGPPPPAFDVWVQ